MEPQDFHLNLLEPYITRPPPPLLEPTKDEVNNIIYSIME